MAKTHLWTALLLGFLQLNILPLGAESQKVPTSVLLGVSVRNERALDGFEAVVLEALMIEIKRVGLIGIEVEDELEVWDDDRVLQFAERLQADFVMAARYRYDENRQVQLQLLWYDVEKHERTAAVEREVRIDLFTDTVIAAAAQEILEGTAERSKP